eukprot:247661_1
MSYYSGYPLCGRCGKGLIYSSPFMLTKTNSGYASGYVCNKCSCIFRNRYSYHCKYCQYDVCSNCYVKSNKTNYRANDDLNDNGYYKIYSRPKYDTYSSKKNNKLVNHDEKKFVAMIKSALDDSGEVTIKPDNDPCTYTIRSRSCKPSDEDGHGFKNYKNGVSVCESCGKKITKKKIKESWWKWKK